MRSRGHKLLILESIFHHKCLRLFFLDDPSYLVVTVLDSIDLFEVLELRVEVQTVMLQHSLLLVLFGLRLY